MRKTQVIREAIGSVLSENDTVIASELTIFNYQKTNISDGQLPCVTIVNGTGIHGKGEFGNTEIEIPYRIEIHAKDKIKIQNTLDALAEIIEPIFPIGTVLGGLVEYMNPESFDYTYNEETGNGKMGLNFNIKYEV